LDLKREGVAPDQPTMKVSDLIRRLRGSRGARDLEPARPEQAVAFYAVALVPDEHACAAALGAAGQRRPTQAAPLVPLPECTRSLECQCRLARFADRRRADRRDALSFSRWYSGIERRGGPGRRSTDR
jgi:hypothetical protein